MTNPSFDVLGLSINAYSLAEALERVANRTTTAEGGYVCFTNAHAAVIARQDPAFRDDVNRSFLSLLDGRSLYWLGWMKGIEGIERVAGPDFFIAFLQQHADLRHYFFGSTQATLDRLVENLKRRVPALNVVGTRSPSFGPVEDTDYSEDIDAIRDSNAEIVWVALGAPKQETWMATYCLQLTPAVLLGVGAAFDFSAGTVKRAPPWLQRLGLEWGYRLMQEPRRLWRRYLTANVLFVYYVIRDTLVGRSSY